MAIALGLGIVALITMLIFGGTLAALLSQASKG
jgi:hypothetical protein